MGYFMLFVNGEEVVCDKKFAYIVKRTYILIPYELLFLVFIEEAGVYDA